MNKKKIIISVLIFLFIVAIIIVIIRSCSHSNIVIEEEEQVVIEPIYKYGICISDYDVIDDVIEPNQNLSEILVDFNIPHTVISKIAESSKGVCDVRRLRSGNSYRLIVSKDSLRELHYLVYDISPIEYAIYSFKDSISAYTGFLPSDTIKERIVGTINTSLWNAVIDAGASPVMAAKLSEVFAWSIDFFGIQKDDSFDVIYEEIYVENERVGYGDILAAKFVNAGKEYKAYRFNYDGKDRYFDESGKALKSQFLKAPLKYKRISSGFSHARRHPITKKVRPHHGVDYAAPSGTPVHSIGDGLVIAKGWDNKGGGNYIKIKHNSVYTTLYMHLKGFAKGIRKGSRVSQGQLIGYVGSTGMSTGPHLDFRVFKNGKAINPLTMKSVPTDPVPDTLMDRFIINVKNYNEIFDM